ncbi:MAG: M48 family metalloprotease, partial [Promethearchaeota archaeon]
MKKNLQIVLIGSFIFGTIGIIIGLYFSHLIQFPTKILDIALWIGFWVFWVGVINEGFHWVKNGKRSDWADLVIIAFLFITVFLITRDVLLSFVGAFSIYLLFGIEELKEYEILNKIVLISVITYNVIFVAGILDQIFQKDGLWQNIAFSFSFWLILILGFVFFGRKYIIVFRFMSVQYLTLLLYVVAWLVIATINYVASIDLKEWIYEALIITNLIVYAFSGPLINLLMGFHRENDPELNQMVREVAKEVGLDPNKIQVRFGKYPILNAMAYGAFWNMNMAIIAPNKETIPMNEMKGIIAHELGHLKQKHTLILTIISTIEILLFQLLQWPVTMYDYVFNKENMPFELWVFLVINFGISIFLYIIVRYLEGNADKIAKKSGYSSSISKGLYNLESFYATSHEVGLDATLLSDEKVTPNNQMLQYYSTAQYLNRMIVNPSRSILLSNFINSHPPSFHRIMIILNDQDVSSFRESLMPLV